MILLLGATGYLGRAFADELRRRGCNYIPLSRQTFDYTNRDLLFWYVRKTRPELVINAASYSGRPNVDACETSRPEAFRTNTLLPQTVARVCLMTNTVWAHLSTGCVYSGAKVFQKGKLRIERDLNRPELRQLFDAHPEDFLGFSEVDEPNFTFRHRFFNYYSGTKAMAEEALGDCGPGYVWRLLLPFNERNEPCNFLSRLQQYARIYDHLTSLSHLEDCVRACLDLWERRTPFGTYNVVNPGVVTTRQVVEMIGRTIKPDSRFEFWADDQEFYESGANALRSNCILDVTKAAHAGVQIRRVEEAIEDALGHWWPFEPNGHPVQSSAMTLSCC
jgi:UDP-glucose 4,6-dehydratase